MYEIVETVKNKVDKKELIKTLTKVFEYKYLHIQQLEKELKELDELIKKLEEE